MNFGKRSFDVVCAALGLLVAAPVIAILVVLVRRDSEGPGLFSQERVGRCGNIFRCHKLRTMYAATPNVPSHHATASQITRIGNHLRRTKLDELPQLWNVVKGEMSFVGPRPCLPSQHELIEERRRLGLLELRPGITGVAQVAGIDMSDPVKLALKDAEYLKAAGLRTDLRLLWLTVTGSGRGDRIS